MRHSIKHVKGQLIKTGNFIQKGMKDKKKMHGRKKKQLTLDQDLKMNEEFVISSRQI
jgi:hypothetical protein